MKGLAILTVITVFIAGLAIAQSELTNPFSAYADLNTVQVKNQRQADVNAIDLQAYQQEIEAQTKAEVEEIMMKAEQEKAVQDAQTQASLDDLQRQVAERRALSSQAIQHDQEMKQIEQQQTRVVNDFKLKLLKVAGYASIVILSLSAIILVAGIAVRIARNSEWSEDKKLRMIAAAKRREEAIRRSALRNTTPLTAPTTVHKPNGRERGSNTPYHRLPRAE